MVGLCGCRDDRRHQTSEISRLEVVAPALPKDAPPLEVVKALLPKLAAAQQARQQGMSTADAREAYRKTMAEVRGFAAAETVFENLRRVSANSVPVDMTVDGAVRLVADNWVSIVAHYADSLTGAAPMEVLNDQTRAVVVLDVWSKSDDARRAKIAGELGVSADAAAVAGETDPGRKLKARLVAEGIAPVPGGRVMVSLVKGPQGLWRVVRIDLDSGVSSTIGRKPPPIQPGTIPAPTSMQTSSQPTH